jgi:hypothetical protein
LRDKLRQIAAGDHRRIASSAAQDVEHHRGHRRFAARPGHGDRAMACHEMREQFRAMNDRDVLRLGRSEIRHPLFDRGRDH